MYLFCYQKDPTSIKYLKKYLFNIKTRQFIDLFTMKKVVLDNNSTEDLRVASECYFYDIPDVTILFNNKNFFATCPTLDNRNYNNSPLHILGYQIESSKKNEFFNNISFEELTIRYHIRSYDDRVDKLYDYKLLNFKNTI